MIAVPRSSALCPARAVKTPHSKTRIVTRMRMRGPYPDERRASRTPIHGVLAGNIFLVRKLAEKQTGCRANPDLARAPLHVVVKRSGVRSDYALARDDQAFAG